MESLKEFLVSNWQYFSVALVVLLEVILMIIKKRPKKYDEFVDCISQAIVKIPFFVCEAEASDEIAETGEDKKQLVIRWLFTFCENTLKRDLTVSEEQYAFKTFSHFIEKVLSAPTKKGGLGREDE